MAQTIKRSFALPVLQTGDNVQLRLIREEPQVVGLRGNYSTVKLVRVSIKVMQTRRVSLTAGALTSVGYIRFGVIPNFRRVFTTDAEKEQLTDVHELQPGFEEIHQEVVVYSGEEMSLFETDLAQLPLKDASPVVFTHR